MKTILILFLNCIFLIGYSQNLNIKGRVSESIEQNLAGVSYATITLKKDSVFITGTTSDERGYFTLPGLVKGNYHLSVSFVGYETFEISLENIFKNINLGDIIIYPSTVDLKDITITASGIVNKLDRKIIFPNQAQILNSSDGMDLLHRLHLSGIEIKRADNSVKGVRGGEVKFRINGASADKNEVLAINPKHIIRIEYHDEPSLRYGDVEVVIDYIVRRQESGGSVMLQANNSPTTIWGEEFVSAKINHRKSEFRMEYGFDYRGYKGYQDKEEDFLFVDGTSLSRLEEGNPAKERYRLQNFRTSYSLVEPEKYLFLATLKYYNENTPESRLNSVLYERAREESRLQMMDISKSNIHTPSLNLYYQHNLKKDQFIVLDVVGTYLSTDSKRQYSEWNENQISTDILTDIDGKKYSIIGEGIYENIFEPGRLSIGIKHAHNFSKNEYKGYTNTQTDMIQSNTNFYAEWFGRINKFTYASGIGGVYTNIDQADINYKEVLFTPMVRLGYQFNSNAELRYQGRMMVQSPSLGDLNDVEQAIDSLQVRRGNPILEPYKSYLNRITFSLNKKKFRLNLDLSDHYSVDPIMQSTFRESDKFIRMMENQKRWHNVFASANLVYPFSFNKIEGFLSVRGGLNWVDSKGKEYRYIIHDWFISSTIDINWKSWNTYASVGNIRERLIGETVTERPEGLIIGVGYRWNRLYVNSFLMSTLTKWVSTTTDHNQYAFSRKSYYIPANRNFLVIRLTWSFEFGRRFKSGNKRINNSDSDTGIMQVSR